jgi:hypothetical protein
VAKLEGIGSMGVIITKTASYIITLL